jgi:hypothetical protein
MSIFDYFVGAPQSKYASIAMFTSIFVICLAILFTNTDISFGNRLIVVAIIFLMSLFPIALSLFELTCIATGGKNTKPNLCFYWAWFVAILVIIYSFILIIVTISSMFTYKKALDKVELAETSTKISKEDANAIAKNMLGDNNDVQARPSPPVPVVSQPVVAPAPEFTSQPPIQQPMVMPPVQRNMSSGLSGYSTESAFMEL